MKSSIFSSTLSLMFLCLFGLSLNAQTPWAYNGNHIYNTNSGNVGINTSSPLYKLHVVGNRIRLGNNTTATAKTLDLRTDGTQLDIVANNGHLFLGSATGNTILQNNLGKVGVGISNPLYKMHVVGDRITLSSSTAADAESIALRTDGSGVDLTATNGNLFVSSTSSVIMQSGGGKVGIGAGTPAAQLHVKGDDNTGSASTLRITSGTQNMLLDGNEIDALTDPLYLNHNSSQNVFVGTGGGNVRIGSAVTPTAKLDVGGDVRCFNLFTNSDRRYKTGIKTLESALDKVLAMRGTSYDFATDQIPADYTAGKQIGFIAQEMQTVMPELVKTDDAGMMSVNYIGVIPVLVEALKEQHEVISEKETRIATLEAQNKELKDRLARIETALGIVAERQEVPAAVAASVSPNPSTGIVTISLNNTVSAKSVTVKVLDNTGREIASRSAAGAGSVQFDLSQFPAGVYVAQVVADGNVVSANKVQLVK